MVHALDGTRRALRPGGVILELHPLLTGPRIEIRRGDDTIPLGRLADPSGRARVNAIRAVLRDFARDGRLEVVARRWFDWEIGNTSVDGWLKRREEYGATSIIPPGFLPRARRLMKRGDVLMVHNRARASVLRPR